MWRRGSTEIDALRSKYGSPESRRELRRKLRYQSSPEGHGFVLASSNKGTRVLPLPAKDKDKEEVDGIPM